MHPFLPFYLGSGFVGLVALFVLMFLLNKKYDPYTPYLVSFMAAPARGGFYAVAMVWNRICTRVFPFDSKEMRSMLAPWEWRICLACLAVMATFVLVVFYVVGLKVLSMVG